MTQGKNNLFSNETLTEIGEKYRKTAAQVNLRFLIQSGVVVILKSTHKERMEKNFNLFDFSLTEEEMQRLETLDLGHSQFIDHYAPEVAQMFVDAGKYHLDADRIALAGQSAGVLLKECLEDFASVQEKRAYIQGYVDFAQVLHHMGLLKESENLKWNK